MIDYSEVKPQDVLRIVGAGAPGFAEIGDLVRVVEVTKNSVKVEDRRGETAEFMYGCGAARLEPTEFVGDVPPDPTLRQQLIARLDRWIRSAASRSEDGRFSSIKFAVQSDVQYDDDGSVYLLVGVEERAWEPDVEGRVPEVSDSRAQKATEKGAS